MSTALDLGSIKPSLNKLQTIERELTASLIERDEVIRASLVARNSRSTGGKISLLSPEME